MPSIRPALEKDIPRLKDLLLQVLTVHHEIRPDLFKADCTKYNDRELAAMIGNELRPVFVYVDDDDVTQGYVFCVIEQHPGNNILTDIKTLYLDDLCVDESLRGEGIGKKLYEYAKKKNIEIENFKERFLCMAYFKGIATLRWHASIDDLESCESIVRSINALEERMSKL